MKLFSFTVTVSPMGHYSFPIDMLRYDGLYPDSENDSGNIHMTIDRAYKMNRSELLELKIQLKGYKHAGWIPTEGRWKSFGWKVESYEKGNAY